MSTACNGVYVLPVKSKCSIGMATGKLQLTNSSWSSCPDCPEVALYFSCWQSCIPELYVPPCLLAEVTLSEALVLFPPVLLHMLHSQSPKLVGRDDRLKNRVYVYVHPALHPALNPSTSDILQL